jgi:hypothetical protein
MKKSHHGHPSGVIPSRNEFVLRQLRLAPLVTAVGKVISLAKYQDVMRHSALWWESGGKAPVNENGQLEVAL